MDYLHLYSLTIERWIASIVGRTYPAEIKVELNQRKEVERGKRSATCANTWGVERPSHSPSEPWTHSLGIT